MTTHPIMHPIVLITVGIFTLGFVCAMAVSSKRHRTSNRLAWILRIIMVLLVLIMAFRPSLAGGEGKEQLSDFDILFVIDITNSMVAEDYNGDSPRLDGVEEDVNKLVEKFAGSRFSVMTFGNETISALPYTSDTDAVASSIDAVITEITVYSTGSSIDEPLDEVKTVIRNRSKKHPDRVQLLFYFGDGEQTAKQKPKSMAALKPLVKGGAIMGYGTTQGGKMKESLGYTSEDPIEWVSIYEDGKRVPAVSKIDEDNLKQIASEIGIKYSHRTGTSGIGEVTNSIQSQKFTQSTKSSEGSRDLYWILAFILGSLSIADCTRISINNHAQKRKPI